MKKDYEELARIVGDAYDDRADKMSILAAALDFFSIGSRYRQDAMDIINGCYPEYFNEDEANADTEDWYK